MNITYDKKMLKRIHKGIKTGKKKSVLKSAINYSLLFFVFMIVLMGVFEWKTEENFTFNFVFVLKWFLLAIFNFFVSYYFGLKQWAQTKALYDETIKYFKQHNPDYIKDLDL